MYLSKKRENTVFSIKNCFHLLFHLFTIIVMQHKIFSYILRQKTPIFRWQLLKHRKRLLHRSRSWLAALLCYVITWTDFTSSHLHDCFYICVLCHSLLNVRVNAFAVCFWSWDLKCEANIDLILFAWIKLTGNGSVRFSNDEFRRLYLLNDFW